MTVWVTGLPAAGKTTLAQETARKLASFDIPVRVLDGDELRGGVSADLGFSRTDRREQCDRAARLASELAAAGNVVIVALVSPYASDRAAARERHRRSGLAFLEVFLDTPLAECERRDPNGLYAAARAGRLSGLTGVDDPYQAPRNAGVVIGCDEPVCAAVDRLYALLAPIG